MFFFWISLTLICLFLSRKYKGGHYREASYFTSAALLFYVFKYFVNNTTIFSPETLSLIEKINFIFWIIWASLFLYFVIKKKIW